MHKDRVWVVVSHERVKPIDLHFLQVVYDSRCDRWWYICRGLNMFIHGRDFFPIRPTTQKGRQVQHAVLKPMATRFAGNGGELRGHVKCHLVFLVLILRCSVWLQLASVAHGWETHTGGVAEDRMVRQKVVFPPSLHTQAALK